jgi:hypothetical protein
MKRLCTCVEVLILLGLLSTTAQIEAQELSDWDYAQSLVDIPGVDPFTAQLGVPDEVDSIHLNHQLWEVIHDDLGNIGYMVPIWNTQSPGNWNCFPQSATMVQFSYVTTGYNQWSIYEFDAALGWRIRDWITIPPSQDWIYMPSFLETWDFNMAWDESKLGCSFEQGTSEMLGGGFETTQTSKAASFQVWPATTAVGATPVEILINFTGYKWPLNVYWNPGNYSEYSQGTIVKTKPGSRAWFQSPAPRNFDVRSFGIETRMWVLGLVWKHLH